MSQLISLKDETSFSSKPLIHVLSGGAFFERSNRGSLTLYAATPFDDFIRYAKRYKNHNFLSGTPGGGGRIIAYLGKYTKLRGAATERHDSLSLKHQGWGRKTLTADLSIDADNIPAKVWNNIQGFIIDPPGFIVSKLLEAAICKTQYFLHITDHRQNKIIYGQTNSSIVFSKAEGTGSGRGVKFGEIGATLERLKAGR